MIKRCRYTWVLFSVMAILCVSIGRSEAENSPRIAVLPFEIHADKDLSYLKTQIPGIIQGQLEKEGGVIVDAGSVPTPEDSKGGFTLSRIRSIGESLKVDYMVWGSLTRLGKKISLDAKLLDLKNAGGPEYIYGEGDDIENLLATVNTVSADISIRMFKFETVTEILVKGNDRIESDAIMKVIKTKVGDRYQKSRLSEDLKRIYDMGYFEDIRIEAEHSEKNNVKGTRVIFTVKEKPTVRNVKIKGNKALDEEKIKKEINITTGSILNSAKIKANIKQIETLYLDKHYHNTKVTYKTYPLENNQADLEFVIEEGEKVLIKTITFIGNKEFKNKRLLKIMKTDEKGFFSWLTSSGELNMSDLNTDINNINAEYQKEGFIDAKVGEPEIEYRKEGKKNDEKEWIFITIKIDEGVRYKMGKLDINGDLIDTKENLLKFMLISKEKFCNKEVLQKDIIALTDLYSDKGYATTDVRPKITRKPDNTADIELDVKKGNLVYFDRILIGGNTVTRDKVIRRQIQVYEQELFSGSKLKRSVRNLYRMDYFEDVKVNTPKGSKEDSMDLTIDVKEKPTGTFTFGMGYSSQDNLFGTVAVAKRNLFGRDQTLNVQAEFGSVAEKYSLSFTEPWLFDIPLSGQGEIYDMKRQYDYYDKKAIGGALKLGYPVFDYTRLYGQYTYEIDRVSNLNYAYVDMDTINLNDTFHGSYITRKLSTTLHYDSRDRAYNAQATEGSDCALTVDYTGGPLGGDIDFTKVRVTLGRYFPMWFKFIGFLHSEGGYVRNNKSDSYLPDYEKFYLGGMNSVRGFRYQDIHLLNWQYARNADGSYALDTNNEKIPIQVPVGGEEYLQFNAELLRPLFGTEGFLGVLFFDMGQVYEQDSKLDLDKLRKAYGIGIRWYSPIGPIRFERGYIIHPESGEPTSGRWDFTMGGVF